MLNFDFKALNILRRILNNLKVEPSRRALNKLKVKIYYCRRNLVTTEYASTINASDSEGEKGINCFKINLFLSLPDLIRLTDCFF